jgi:hypothetical protein
MKEPNIGILTGIMEDFQSQIDALTESKDTSWDCYDIDNWQAMIDLLQTVINNINKNT